MIHQIIFSPTGGTKRVCEQICKGFDMPSVITDLCLTDEKRKPLALQPDDVAVIAMPVFMGRVPEVAVRRLRQIDSGGARCVVAAVYGNRAYEDALLEMYDTAEAMDFNVVAAVSAVAEHSIAKVYATGRPDTDDCRELTDFGRTVIGKINRGDTALKTAIPGNRPYRSVNAGPCPVADDSCAECGECAALCPVGAIPVDSPRTVLKDLCISCMRCVDVCPTGARGIGPARAFTIEKLKTVCAVRRGNELFV